MFTSTDQQRWHIQARWDDGRNVLQAEAPSWSQIVDQLSFPATLAIDMNASGLVLDLDVFDVPDRAAAALMGYAARRRFSAPVPFMALDVEARRLWLHLNDGTPTRRVKTEGMAAIDLTTRGFQSISLRIGGSV